MTITYSSNPSVYEMHNTVKENGNADTGEITASVVLQVPWADRWTIVDEIVGGRLEWPYLPGAGCKAFSAAMAGDNSAGATDGQGHAYGKALVTVNFSTKNKDLITESLEPTAEFLTLDWRRFRWGANNGEPILENEAPGKLRLGLGIVRTLHEVPGPLPVSLLTLPGSCNDAAYTSTLLGLTFDEETLLFGTPRLSRTIKMDGSEGFSITLTFTHKPSGWNKYWRAKTETYEEIFEKGGGGRFINYPPDDYSDFLF